MKKYYLGIDLGTSAVKGILRAPGEESIKARCSYEENTPAGWMDAIGRLITILRREYPGEIAAIGLSSQVGTYIVDDRTVIGWQEEAGREELDEIRKIISREEFLQEIGMAHPDLISYPLPRLLYIQRNFGNICEVMMPKERIIRELTGRTVTDVFSMRGIVHPETGRYAESLLNKLGITLRLPVVQRSVDRAGRITAAAAQRFGLTEGTPVYLGCNDFFAGLLGMGVCHTGDAFDLSGTSEHIGMITGEIQPNGFVSGRYFTGFCTYGGTKSSGSSCRFAREVFSAEELNAERLIASNPPIFLPYLNGERAPVFDENARGVYFGISDGTKGDALAYSAMEGVVFSLYDIASRMEMPAPQRLICGGGSAENALMNTLRASLFGCTLLRSAENDASALGACMLAMVGAGVYADPVRAAEAECGIAEVIQPDCRLTSMLKQRYDIYRQLYGALKEPFRQFANIQHQHLEE